MDHKISAIVFDLNGTLVPKASENAYHNEKLLDWIEDRHGKTLSLRQRTAALIELEQRETTTRGLVEGRYNLVYSHWIEYRDGSDFDYDRLLPSRNPTLGRLISALASTYQLGLLTNSTRLATDRAIETLAVKPHFHVTYTCDDGPRKPDRAAFDAVIRGLGVDPQETLFVGNNLRKDLQPAADLGARTLQLTGHHQVFGLTMFLPDGGASSETRSTR